MSPPLGTYSKGKNATVQPHSWKPRDGVIVPMDGNKPAKLNVKNGKQQEAEQNAKPKRARLPIRCHSLLAWLANMVLKQRSGKWAGGSNRRTAAGGTDAAWGGMRSRSCSVNRKLFEGAFCEHTWDLRQVHNFYVDSNIDVHSPLKSTGLSTQFAQAQLALKGPNVLPKAREVGKWELLLHQFWNMLWALLIGASLLSLLQFFLDTRELINLWITLILFGMIFVMCICSWLQEMRARQVIRGFQRLLPEYSQVIRDGQEMSIGASDVVVGDLVRIRSGQRVPADLRVLHCVQLKLEASSITGESEPVEYQAEEVPERFNVFEARNVAFNGSLCVEGEGLGIVIRIGENTVIGQTARLTTGQAPNESRLEQQIRKYVKFLIIMACSVASLVFVVGGFVHRWTNVVQLLANGFLVCAIGMVPCGLPATVTSILTLIARRLAGQNVYVKRLDICEALGQVSIIASDKTGTLTKNEMVVTGLWHWDAMIEGYPQSEPITITSACPPPPPSSSPTIPEGDNEFVEQQQQIASMPTFSSCSVNTLKAMARYGEPVDAMLVCMTVCNTATIKGAGGDGEFIEKREKSAKRKHATKTSTTGTHQQNQHADGQMEQQQQQRHERKASLSESIKAVLWAQQQQQQPPPPPSTPQQKSPKVPMPEKSGAEKCASSHFQFAVEKVVPDGDDGTVAAARPSRPNAKKSLENLEKAMVFVPSPAATAVGTPSEVAMLNYANALINVHRCRQEHEDVAFEVPFNSKRKWHLKIVRMAVHATQADYRLFIKGASEVLATMCNKIMTKQGVEQPFGTGAGQGMERLDSAYTELAGIGHRVIGFATTRFRAPVEVEFSLEAGNVPLGGLTFLGVCAIMDPPRDQTREAIRQCQTAGIKVFMVTGDHQLTACAIARQIGLIEGEEPFEQQQQQVTIKNNDNNKEGTANGGGKHANGTTNGGGGGKPNLKARILSAPPFRNIPSASNLYHLDSPHHQWALVKGQQISHLTTQQWDELIMHKRSVIFARTTPEQKLLIVEQCQRRGQIMAMTGDGVNDAPALKKAEIGIAMGSGSEVAKQAADIVLVDDNFSSIVRAVEEGRTMYENIKKLLAYTMPHSFPEVWPIIVNFCFGMPVGITALQILAIDLGTEIFPGISLAKERPEGDVMARPPRNVRKVLISNSLLSYAYLYTGQFQSLGCFLAYCCVFWSHGISIRDLWMSALRCWQPDGDIFYSNGRAFTVPEQLLIGRQACSAWQMGIVFGQFFNIWSARTRRVSLFQHGFCSNRSLLIALGIEMALICCYVYLPGLNEFLGGAAIPWQCWAVVAGVGLFINGYNEIRKFFVRRFPTNPVVRWLRW